MRKILFFCLSSVVSVSFAGSMGDLATYDQNWSGFYVGGNLGGIWSDFNGSASTSAASIIPASFQIYNANSSSVIGGGQLGYNWQMQRLILGTEVSVDGMNLSQSHTLTSAEVPNLITWDYTAGDIFSSKMDWQVEWVGRIGVPVQKWLPYGLAGVAFTQAEVQAVIVPVTQGGVFFPGTSGSSTKTLVGGVVGVGTDYAISDHIRAGLEYRYSFYGNETYPLGVNAVGPVGSGFVLSPMSANMNMNTSQVVARLNYQF